MITWPLSNHRGIILLILLFAGSAALFMDWRRLYSGEQPPDVWTHDQLVQALERGVVKRIVIDNRRAIIETTDSTRGLIYLPEGKDLNETLRNLNIPEESLRQIEVTTARPQVFCSSILVFIMFIALSLAGARRLTNAARPLTRQGLA